MTLSPHDWMQAWVNLLHLGTFYGADVDAHCRKELGIGIAEQDLIKQLAINDGEITLSELARRVFLSKAGMTKMIDRLEGAGLVRRVRSDADRRVISAVLTAKGEKTFQQSRKILRAYVENNFRAHLADKEVLELKHGLTSLLQGLDRWEDQQRHLRGEAHDK